MFLRRGKTRIGAVAVLAVLAMALAVPAGAAPWGGFGEARELMSGFLPRVLAWLDLGPNSSAISKSDDGMTIDPNGGKAMGSALAGRGGMRVDDGSRVVPGRRH